MPILFVGESFTVAVFLGTGKVWIRGGGSMNIFRRKCFVSQCRKLSQVNPSVLCFKKFPVAKNLGIRGGEYQDFPSKVFCLTVPIFFVGESFTFVVFSGTGRVWIRGGMSVKIFRQKLFVSQCRKIS